MAGSCAIQTIEEFNKAENKTLKKEIDSFTKDDLSKITLYNISLLEDFKGSPTLLGVRSYLEIKDKKEATKLSDQNKKQVLNMFLGKTWTAEEFLSAFSENGVFNISPKKISNYLGIKELINISGREEQLKDLYFQIKKFFPKEASPIEAYFATPNTFLSDEVENPDIIEDKIKSTYAGVETFDEVQAKKETFGSKYPERVLMYMRENGTLGKPAVSDIDINGRSEYYDNLRTKLLFLIDNSTDLSSIQDNLENFDEFNRKEITDFFKNEFGIDLKLNTIEGTPENISAFLETLYDYVISPNRNEKADNVYKTFLKLSPVNALGATKKHSFPDVKNAIVINSKSEQEVFDRHHSILVSYPYTYTRVEKKSVNWAVYQIFETEKSFIEDRSVFEGVPNIEFSEKNRGDIELQIEANIIKAAKKYGISNELAANKFLYQLPFEEKIQTHPGTVNTAQFIPTLFRELPYDGKNIFSLRKDGSLYMRGQGEYTRKLLEISLSEDTYKNMVAYANISMEPSMSHLRDRKENPTKSDYRNFYTQNPKALENINENVIKVVGTAIVSPGIKQEFIKFSGEIYEKVNDRLGIFEKLSTLNQNYFNLPEPIQTLDNEIAESIIENTLETVEKTSIVYKPEKIVNTTTVSNPVLQLGKKTLKQFAEDYRKYFDKAVHIGYNGIFSLEEKNAFLESVKKLNDQFVKVGYPVHYKLGGAFFPIRSNNTYELLSMQLNKGYSLKAVERVNSEIKISSIPSQTLKEIHQQPFLTPDQVKEAYSGISDSDVTNWTEKDLDC